MRLTKAKRDEIRKRVTAYINEERRDGATPGEVLALLNTLDARDAAVTVGRAGARALARRAETAAQIAEARARDAEGRLATAVIDGANAALLAVRRTLQDHINGDIIAAHNAVARLDPREIGAIAYPPISAPPK